MKYFLLSLILASLFVSCVNDETNKKEVTVDLIDVTFSTELNTTKTDWKLSEIYKDTLEFISFDDSYDYSYAIFKTSEGNTVSLVCDDVIDSKYTHGVFAIEWKIDSLYEAGEDEQLYYDERLLTYRVIEQPVYFGEFLTEFIKAYSSDSKESMAPFLNEQIGFYTTFKPDLYCVINQKNSPDVKPFIDLDCKVLDEKLIGNQCDGFPNIEDGLYFETIIHEEVPYFESPVGENMNDFTFPLNSSYHSNEFKRVTIITNELQYVQLYFVNLDGNWYLWAEDSCDCGA